MQSSQPEGIEAWAQDLYRRFGGPIAVALELSKGPIVSALQKYDFMVLYPINPSHVGQIGRETLYTHGAKDDPSDAELAVDLITRHAERFSPLKPQSVNMRKLIGLVEQRKINFLATGVGWSIVWVMHSNNIIQQVLRMV